MRKLTRWEQKWVETAEYFSKWSKDPNTKVGAVLVFEGDKDFISMGYNGIPRGVFDDVKERSSRENGEKYYWYAHAERNALYNAARKGVTTRGATAFLNVSIPCTGCAIGLIQSGIKKVVCKHGDFLSNSDKWAEEGKRSQMMFSEANIEVVYYDNI